MTGNLSKIILSELQMNVDFMLRVQDNFSVNILKIPDSFLYHISSKYSIPIDELHNISPQIADFLHTTFGDRNLKQVSTKNKSITEKQILKIELPVAKFSNI